MVVLGFNATLTAKVIAAVGDAHVFPGFLTSVLTQLFLPKPPTTFLTCSCRDERRKYAGKESSPQPGIELSGQESDTLTTDPLVQGNVTIRMIQHLLSLCVSLLLTSQ